MVSIWSRGVGKLPHTVKVHGFVGIMDKTYADAFKYFIELMKRDLESDKL